MSSTNKTTYYNLSQFANTDKPSWLNDYNNDMTIIDTNIKNNANNISSNAGLIGDLTNLTTTSKTNLVSAINEVDNNCDTNTTSIGTLSNLTTTAKDSLVNAINEVASSSGGSCLTQFLDVTSYNTQANALNYDTLTKGIYILYNTTQTTDSNHFIYLKTSADSQASSNNVIATRNGTLLIVAKNWSDSVGNNDTIGIVKNLMTSPYDTDTYFYDYTIKKNISTNVLSIRKVEETFLTSRNYNAIGSNYNSSAIQYLKNVNGTLNWVTESNVTPSMIYMGKINAYNSTANALDLSNYPAGTRIVLKHNDSSRGFYLKVGTNVAEVTVTTSNDEAILNNTYYIDINSISASDASVSVVWASTYEWCPIVTNTIMVTFASGGATVGTITRNMQGYTLFQLEEDSSGNLNTNVLQYFITIRTKAFSKQYAPQRPAIHYLDKDKNSCLMSFTSITSGSQQVYDGIMTTKQASASGLYETYKIHLELNYSNGVYQSHVLNKTKIGDVFDATAISGYSASGTKTLGLNNGVLEWV